MGFPVVDVLTPLGAEGDDLRLSGVPVEVGPLHEPPVLLGPDHRVGQDRRQVADLAQLEGLAQQAEALQGDQGAVAPAGGFVDQLVDDPEALVPAGVLVLEVLEVGLVERLLPPPQERPHHLGEHAERARAPAHPLVHVVEHLLGDLEAPLLELPHVRAVELVEDVLLPQLQRRAPSPPLGPVLVDEGDRQGERRELPPGRPDDVLLEKLDVAVAGLHHRHQGGVAVGHVAGLVGLDGQAAGGVDVVAVGGGDVGQGDEQGVGGRRLAEHLEVHQVGDRVVGDEVLHPGAEDVADDVAGPHVRPAVEPVGVGVVVLDPEPVPALHLHLEMPHLVEHLEAVAGLQLGHGNGADGPSEGAVGVVLGRGQHGGDELHVLAEALLDLGRRAVADGAFEHAVEVVVLLLLHGAVLDGREPEGVVAVLGEVVLRRFEHGVLEADALRLPVEVAEPLVLADPAAGAVGAHRTASRS